jgi:hypothetical protein
MRRVPEIGYGPPARKKASAGCLRLVPRDAPRIKKLALDRLRMAPKILVCW